MRLWAKNNWRADVAVFENLDAGKSLETFLRHQGFEARTYDDKLFRYFLFLRPPRITHRVQVRLSEAARAAELLEREPPEVLQSALRCPSCHSLRVSYPQMTRRFVLPTILLHLGIIFRVIEHQCYCEHCHFIWHLSPKAASTPRAAVPAPQTH